MLESTLSLGIQRALASGIPAGEIRKNWRGIHRQTEALKKTMTTQEIQKLIDDHFLSVAKLMAQLVLGK